MADLLNCSLIEINRNSNGDYYFIYSVPKVINHIRPGSKARDELLIVGVPKTKLVSYLKHDFPGSDIYAVDAIEFYKGVN